MTATRLNSANVLPPFPNNRNHRYKIRETGICRHIRLWHRRARSTYRGDSRLIYSDRSLVSVASCRLAIELAQLTFSVLAALVVRGSETTCTEPFFGHIIPLNVWVLHTRLRSGVSAKTVSARASHFEIFAMDAVSSSRSVESWISGVGPGTSVFLSSLFRFAGSGMCRIFGTRNNSGTGCRPY